MKINSNNQTATTETNPLKSCDQQGIGTRNHGSLNFNDLTLTIDSQNQNKDVERNGINGAGSSSSADDDDDDDDTTKAVIEQKNKTRLKWSDMSTKSKYTLLLCSLGTFFSGIEFFFIVPFYPIEAHKKGLSSLEIGAVLASLQVVIFLSSPVYGHFLPKFGAKFIYLSGTFVGACATILFGFVHYCPTSTSFLVLSIICRGVTALGISAFVTSGFAILTNQFPDHVATAFGIAEVANGVGFMSAPAVGGALYQVGGFMVPFVVIGCLVLLNGLFLYAVLPPPTTSPGVRKGSILTLFKSMLFCVAICNVFVSAIGITFLEPTLGKRIEMFNLSPALIGLLFLIAPALYSSTTPFFGYLSDVKEIPSTVVMCGTALIALCYLLLGPTPGIPVTSGNIWLVVVCLALLGAGFGATAIPTVKLMVTAAKNVGFPDNLDTYGIVSGGFYSAICAGGILGNFMGGALLDTYGFPLSATVIVFIHLLTLALTMTYFGIRRFNIKKNRTKNIEDQQKLMTQQTRRK